MSLAHRTRTAFCDNFAIAMPIADPRNCSDFRDKRKQCCIVDLRVQWKVASDLRFRAAFSEPKTPSFCGISGDLAPSTRKSLALAIVRFWCAKGMRSFQTYEQLLSESYCQSNLLVARKKGLYERSSRGNKRTVS